LKYNYHIAVIGAGSGGLVVAAGAAGLGARVVLFESEKMGGDCLNAGCVPSKTFLKSAHLAQSIRHSNEFALSAELAPVNLRKVMGRVASVISEIEPHDSKERYQKLGVTVVQKRAQLIDAHTVEAGCDRFTARNIVIATGSEPVFPNIPGLKTIDYLTNKNIFKLEKLPTHLIVLGGGPIGLELGQGMAHLGSRVTIIDRGDHLFKKDDPEVAPILEACFKKDGINLVFEASIQKIQKRGEAISVQFQKSGKTEEIVGDQVLVSIGRAPVSNHLGLNSVGVALDDRGYIKTDERLRTSVRNIYACGDVTGPYQFTHMAGYQAGIILRNIIFRLPAKVDYSAVPWTTYTKPEVAHVGYTEPWAKSLGIFAESIVIPIASMDRAKSEEDRDGFLKLNLNGKGKIIGASLVSEHAGEMIPLATLAIQQKLKATAFLNLIFSYPTEAEIFKFASLEKIKKSFKPWQSKLIRCLFLRG
jgi:pyruvate/2-oxoglutarate dehydrogenase complex dihydrolipoamide dehydrogenase (E3) component